MMSSGIIMSGINNHGRFLMTDSALFLALEISVTACSDSTFVSFSDSNFKLSRPLAAMFCLQIAGVFCDSGLRRLSIFRIIIGLWMLIRSAFG